MKICNKKYIYAEDEKGNFTTTINSSNGTEYIRTVDKFGNEVYNKYGSVELETVIEYDDDNNILKSENNYGTVCEYKDNKITSCTLNNCNETCINNNTKFNVECNTSTSVVDDKVVSYYENMTFENGTDIKQKLYISPNSDYINETFNVKLNSLSNTDRHMEVEQVNPKYVYQNIYDQNNNLTCRKSYVCYSEEYFEYDQNNNVSKSECYSNGNLFEASNYDNQYNDNNMIIETQQCIFRKGDVEFDNWFDNNNIKDKFWGNIKHEFR